MGQIKNQQCSNVEKVKKASTSLRAEPRVFFDIMADGNPLGCVVLELDSKRAPRTTANFVALCTDSHRAAVDDRLHFESTHFHRIVPGTYMCGGDVLNGNGTGIMSIYGETFDDEWTGLRHDSAGVLSMLNHGPNSNGSQFLITLKPTPWMDGIYVPFGKVIRGLDVLQKISDEYGTECGVPKSSGVRIVECGQLD